MVQIVSGSNCPPDPPSKWGPLKWEVDGMTPEKAQAVMRAFMVYTHNILDLAEFLHIGACAAEEMLSRASAIPKQVAYYIPDLIAFMKRCPTKMVEAMKAAEHYTKAEKGVRLQTTREINMDVSKKAALILRERRENMGMTMTEVAKRLNVKAHEVSRAEREGLTPYNRLFFPLCELMGIAPEKFGYISYCAQRIQEWRRGKAGENV